MEEKVRIVLNSINEDICKYQGNNMLGEKIIDSFDVMEIISALEEEFDIEIDPGLITSENFANVDKIVGMVEKSLEA